MIRTTVFQSNRFQAVLLPENVAFPDSVREVMVLRDGARRVILPADRSWDDFFASPSIDYGERDQPPAPVREAF
jgi:antitoxin VapB